LKSYLYGAGAEYALHSLLILATSDAPISVVDLARFQQIPERYLAKVFTRMREAQLVVGTEGIAGGFALARPAADIRVLEVLDAVDPDRKLFACAEIRRNCALFGESPPEWATAGSCRIDLFMTQAQEVLREFLASKMLADLVCEFNCKAPPEFAAESSGWFAERRAGRASRRDRSTESPAIDQTSD
jgi:Rrf2 family protein